MKVRERNTVPSKLQVYSIVLITLGKNLTIVHVQLGSIHTLEGSLHSLVRAADPNVRAININKDTLSVKRILSHL